MQNFDFICIHPDVQDGEPVFSGTRIRLETFFDYMRIGVSVNEFLNEFPSITRDQAMNALQLVRRKIPLEQVKLFVSSPKSLSERMAS